ncbi:hypothetical protein QUF88_00435 [Bacillus sp. DX1.1]|uniref:hypothetical protein n=1 Tax=Bacillus sp. DX1.1 TaxID=3055866 RepID=UPI0025A095CA|nr:hypothetical protein [Bacillus sp. DX1.1]MDM5152534.1 hypothetical protein [Bacillus sp. DX1.1]
MPVAVGTVRQGTSEGSSTPVESYGPVASGSSPAPVEQSRPVVNEGSSTPVESYRPVVSESSPAPAEMVTVTHGSPRGTYEVDKEVAASTSDIPMPANRETRTLGQYATDKIKGSVTSTKTSIKQTATEVKEKITNSHTVKNTKRFYQMGENTGKSWRDIVSKNNKKEK